MSKSFNVATLAILFTLLIPFENSQAQTIDPKFNPNLILSDEELMDVDSLSLQQIQTFLQNKNSYLANYSTVNAHGTVKTAAEIIYDASRNNFDCAGVELSASPTEAEKQLKCRKITTVSPKFLLVLLQKEASLIENPSPAQARLDWATGYGCPDNWTCNPYYKGFGKQVNSAFDSAFDNIEDLAPLKSEYFLFLQKGSTVKGRRFRIISIQRDDNFSELMKLGVKELEESGTGAQEGYE